MSSICGLNINFKDMTIFLEFTLAELYSEPSFVEISVVLISALLGPNPPGTLIQISLIRPNN